MASARAPRIPFLLHGVLLVAITVGGALLRARHLDAPFGDGFRGVNNGFYYGQYEKHYRDLGLAGCRFGLVLSHFPGTGEKGLIYNMGHPAPHAWLLHLGVVAAGGDIETGLRLLPLLLATGGILMVYLLGRRWLSPEAGLAAALLAAVSPMWASYGVMAEGAPFLLFLGGLTALCTLRYLDGRGRFLTLLGVFFLGCLMDWGLYLFAPAVWVLCMWRPPGRPFPWRVLWLFPAGILAFLAHLAHGAWILGGAGPMLERLQGMARTASTPGFGPGDWLLRQGTWMLEGFTLPVLLAAAAALGLSAGVRLRDRGRPPVPLFFVVSGGLYMLLFFRHAYEHPFWPLGLGAALFLGGARLVAALAGARGRWRMAGRVLAALLLLWAVAAGVQRTMRLQDRELKGARAVQERAAVVNTHTEPGDLVLTSEDWKTTVFYARTPLIPSVRSWPLLQQVLRDYHAAGCRAPIVFLMRAGDQRDGVRGIARRAATRGVAREEHASWWVFRLPR